MLYISACLCVFQTLFVPHTMCVPLCKHDICPYKLTGLTDRLAYQHCGLCSQLKFHNKSMAYLEFGIYKNFFKYLYLKQKKIQHDSKANTVQYPTFLAA
jgi:hypothetical protein